MRVFTLLLIYVCVSQAMALDLSTRLILAQDAQAIDKMILRSEQLRVARTACRIQLRRKIVPTACYEVLRLEIRDGLHPRASDRARLTTRLDGLCAAAAERLQVTTENFWTSRTCQNAMTQARRIQAYRRSPSDWSEN